MWLSPHWDTIHRIRPPAPCRWARSCFQDCSSSPVRHTPRVPHTSRRASADTRWPANRLHRDLPMSARSPSVLGSLDRCQDSSGRWYRVWDTNWPTSMRGPCWGARSQMGRSPQAMHLDRPLPELPAKEAPDKGHFPMDRLPAEHPSGLRRWEPPVSRSWQVVPQRWMVRAVTRKGVPRRGHWTEESRGWDTVPKQAGREGLVGLEKWQSTTTTSGFQHRQRPGSLLLPRLDGLPWPWTAFPKRP